MDRLADARLTAERRERFHDALARVEQAHKGGDHIRIQQAEEALDAVLNESRARQQQAQAPRTSGLDGGVRTPITREPRPSFNKTIVAAARERRALADAARGN